MKLKRHIIIFFVIVVVAAFVRLFRIADNPPALSWDEVSIGYNAYSILKTGRDEHGRLFPLDTFVAYGDYKPPFAVYATVPPVAVFGLNEFSVRLPSALFGVAGVALLYFVVGELFRGKMDEKKRTAVGLLSSAVMALSPWHVNLSRAGFEANIGMFLVMLGIWCALSVRRNPRLLYVCWLPFVLAVYTFNSSRYAAPFLGLMLLYVLRKRIVAEKRRFFVGAAIACIALLPIVPHLLSKEARLRFVEVNIFSDFSVVEKANLRTGRSTNPVSKFFSNRRFGFFYSFVGHFADNLEPSFLFVRGDGNPKFSTQDTGELYLMDAPFLVIGALALFAGYPELGAFLLYWLVVSIIPAATARETPHALRILNSYPVFAVTIAYGLMEAVRLADAGKKSFSISLKWMLVGIIGVLYGFQIAKYLYNYHTHYPQEFSAEWQYGYREGIRAAEKHASEFDEVFISESIGRAYMYTLFYTKYDPSSFRQTKDSYFDAAGFYHVDGFGKYRFGKMPAPVAGKRILAVMPPGSRPEGENALETVKLLNGQPVLEVYEVK